MFDTLNQRWHQFAAVPPGQQIGRLFWFVAVPLERRWGRLTKQKKLYAKPQQTT